MIGRILVPLDGSALAEAALPCVQELAHLTGASVTLLRIVEPLESTLELAAAAPDERLALVKVDLLVGEVRARDYLATAARQFERDGIEAHTRVAVGPPTERIIQAAGSADLVAMSTHGRSGIGRWVFGSVADAVLRGAPAPVLLIRADQTDVVATGRPRRILVPLDGSELAERALPSAVDLARRAGAAIVLIRSVTWPQEFVSSFANLDPIGGAGLVEHRQGHARAYLAEVGERLTRQGLAVAASLRSEPAAEAILACAAEERADLIVMGTHGRGGLGRWAFGSVADRVLRSAAVPVLLARAGLPADVAIAAPPAYEIAEATVGDGPVAR
jgi:nucleotide-binding universal stress UspA family protein